jgi:hypothetical protein
MWILFSLYDYDDSERHPHSYIVGIFNTEEDANRKRIDLAHKYKSIYFIKEISIGEIYDYDWSNNHSY